MLPYASGEDVTVLLLGQWASSEASIKHANRARDFVATCSPIAIEFLHAADIAGVEDTVVVDFLSNPLLAARLTPRGRTTLRVTATYVRDCGNFSVAFFTASLVQGSMKEVELELPRGTHVR